MRVVLFKLNALGDNVVFLPAVQALRSRHPDWHLTVLTTPAQAELYQGPLAPQRLLTCDKRAFDKSHRRPWELAAWILRVRREHPDACIVAFDQGSAAHLVAKLSGAAVRIGGNLDCIRVHHSLTREVPIPADGRPVSWNWAMAGALEAASGDRGRWPAAPPAPDLRHLLPNGPRSRGKRRRVVVHAGASKALNQWPVGQFAKVSSLLARDLEVVWIAHGGTRGCAPPGVHEEAVDSLASLAGWIAGADLFLGNNSGPMHLASGLGTPGVAVTGPSARGWDPFWHPERWTVLRHPRLACSPCEVPDKELRACANLEHPMACLNHWTPEVVEAACRARLEMPAAAS